MANLTLIYGLRLLPEGEVAEVGDATLKLANGHEARVTMHILEGSSGAKARRWFRLQRHG
jgi:nitrogenase molybdenum-iron protein alpha/beta subunit